MYTWSAQLYMGVWRGWEFVEPVLSCVFCLIFMFKLTSTFTIVWCLIMKYSMNRSWLFLFCKHYQYHWSSELIRINITLSSFPPTLYIYIYIYNRAFVLMYKWIAYTLCWARWRPKYFSHLTEEPCDKRVHCTSSKCIILTSSHPVMLLL